MKTKQAPEINAGSMADIAFLLLVFFLVTTTMDSELGLFRKLPQVQENPIDVIVHKRNVLPILVNGNDKLMLNGNAIKIAELKTLTKEFIANPKDKPNLPERKLETVARQFHLNIVNKYTVSLCISG